MSKRELSAQEAKRLAPGDEHYTAYVGPPAEYDFMGATQFRLLCALGLRDRHRLLDYGCGSLRAGRLFLPYLAPGGYTGFEPNRWLVEDAIEREIGRDMIRIKQPQLVHRANFSCSELGTRFDYVLAQSIFSHCGRDRVATILAEFRDCLTDTGLAAVTFVPAAPGEPDCAESGWIYPRSVVYSAEAIAALVAGAGLHGRRIPWWHPRQCWWVLSKDPARVPDASTDGLLRGAVLFDPELAASRP